MLYAIVALGSLFFIVPLIWMVRTSIMPAWQVDLFPPQWWPAEFQWQNYIDPFRASPFLLYYRNTIFMTTMNVLGVTISCSLVAYGFARLRFPGRQVLFLLVLSTVMLPFHITLIPKYILFTQLGWINTFKPLIVPEWLASDAFFIFLLRQFFLGIPRELEDAAKIDGCNPLQTFGYVIVPVSLPALGVVAIFSFTGHWNAFLTPLLYLNTRDKFTVPLALAGFQARDHSGVSQWGELMAMSLVSMIPVLMAFFIAQKHTLRGIAIGGYKQ
jgi:ABC-type glycerol-3-phosphate transport system permease component